MVLPTVTEVVNPIEFNVVDVVIKVVVVASVVEDVVAVVSGVGNCFVIDLMTYGLSTNYPYSITIRLKK